ncbi:MAG TPA: hypothetical protein VGE31_02020 [Candidatus Paceibacterota bacterium]
MEKPRKIKQAVLSGDTAFLSAAGKKGAEIVNLKKAEERIRNEAIEDAEQWQRDVEEEERRLNTNEHIIDPDGNDLDYSPENDENEKV